MEYKGCVSGAESAIRLEKEGLRLGGRFLDFADVAALRPLNHRVWVDTLARESIEISMLGFSYDGFWEELDELFGKRSLEALFVEEKLVMLSEGDYKTPRGQGRGKIALFEDAVCILPPDCGALRIPLCFTTDISRENYQISFATASGGRYSVGRMGYDTLPFAERAAAASERVKKTRARALADIEIRPPFTHKGLFRTARPEQYWQAAFGKGVCALELFTGEDAATYLYRFDESEELFLSRLEEAMEAMGVYREILYLTEEQLAERPLYRMAVVRSEAVSFLRARLAGRLIHNASHAERLQAFLS